MIKLHKRDAMVIVCGSNRLRLYRYELPSDFEKLADWLKVKEHKLMDRHYRKCGRIIKLFVKAAS